MLNRWIVICLLLTAGSAAAVEKPLPNAEQEARAYALFHQIRCVVCASQSVADSPADVAGAIRQVIREHVAAGESDNKIKEFLKSSYGDSIMMRPPFTAATAVLWFGPTALLIFAVFVIWLVIKSESAKDKT